MSNLQRTPTRSGRKLPAVKSAFRRLQEDLAHSAEIGVFAHEMLHSAALSMGICLTVVVAGQLFSWLGAHANEIEQVAEVITEEVERA